MDLLLTQGKLTVTARHTDSNYIIWIDIAPWWLALATCEPIRGTLNMSNLCSNFPSWIQTRKTSWENMFPTWNSVHLRNQSGVQNKKGRSPSHLITRNNTVTDTHDIANAIAQNSLYGNYLRSCSSHKTQTELHRLNFKYSNLEEHNTLFCF